MRYKISTNILAFINNILISVFQVKKYSTKKFGKEILEIYGISQNAYTKDYILVQKNFTWTSRNEKIDDFIQEMQLKINDYNDIVFEWIPYNQFNDIKEIGKNSFMTIHSAIWRDGPFHYNDQYEKYTRKLNKKVALKCLHNSQNLTEFLINKV